MQRYIFSYPIVNHLRSKLVHSRYVNIKDFEGITVEKLSIAAQITAVESEHVLTTLGITPRKAEESESSSEQRCPQPISASDHLGRSRRLVPIVTFSQRLDDLLGGGIATGRLTEVCGMPGSGKTQLCLQLSVNVQIPEPLGGLGGEVLYIDTEGSFNVERLSDMAEAITKHFGAAAAPTSPESGTTAATPAGQTFTTEGILRGVLYLRCLDFAAFVGMVNILPDFITGHPQVRLIIVDNITYHFRHHFDSNYQLRTNLLQTVSSTLAELAHTHSLAVVVTNQMTTRISKLGRSSVVPALGGNWSHACCNRLCLTDDGGGRRATLVKSSYVAAATAVFQIETAGIRDVPFQSVVPSVDYHETTTGYRNSVDASERLNIEDQTKVSAAKRPRLDIRSQ